MAVHQDTLLVTADEFATLGDIGPAELIRGRVVPLVNPKPRHGRITMRISTPLAVFVRDNKLGEVYAAETGFLVESDPDTVRAPDVAFVRAELSDGHDEDEWYSHAPDLAVEVVSPSDRPGPVKAKVRTWLDHGARSVWVVDPKQKTASIYRADGTTETFAGDDTLRDETVLPGFSLDLKAVFN